MALFPLSPRERPRVAVGVALGIALLAVGLYLNTIPFYNPGDQTDVLAGKTAIVFASIATNTTERGTGLSATDVATSDGQCFGFNCTTIYIHWTATTSTNITVDYCAGDTSCRTYDALDIASGSGTLHFVGNHLYYRIHSTQDATIQVGSTNFMVSFFLGFGGVMLLIMPFAWVVGQRKRAERQRLSAQSIKATGGTAVPPPPPPSWGPNNR